MSSLPLELLVSVDREADQTLGAQIEDQLRNAIRAGTLHPRARVPSTRDLARQLCVSRPIVASAYAQLAAEGYLQLRQGSRPHVSSCVGPCAPPVAAPPPRPSPARFDFHLGPPDLSSFPRAEWLRSLRDGLASIRDEDLGYTDPHGSEVLRTALTEYLGRVRGVVSAPERVFVTSGFAQGRTLVCRALMKSGATRIAVEDPSGRDLWDAVRSAGLTMVPIPVDDAGMQVELLDRARVDAVVVTPAHQYPTGAVMSGERRAALLTWLRRHDAIALEDDYDAEYRYDRAPVGALQSLDAERIVYAGTASKTLAPALRMGWLVLPPRLLDAVAREQLSMDFGGPRIEQHAFADLLVRGELDRHLRRMRGRYRSRRDAMVEALRVELPEAEVCGIAAGLHAKVTLPASDDEEAIRIEAWRRGIALSALGHYRLGPHHGPPALLLSYARCQEATIEAGVKELASAIRSTRRVSRRTAAGAAR